MKRPLSGLRILDLTRVLAGPVATRFLASVGADVLRIDPPNWDEDGNAIEMTVGKTCAGLDLTDMEDRKTFSRLVGSADVLVHGYRADALDRLGFGIERCRTNKPKHTKRVYIPPISQQVVNMTHDDGYMCDHRGYVDK